jgi:2-amino-4-hydroxy-6-hydroxymethyldihydropteridine diphosphokinase
MGRLSNPQRNAPRVIDVDILYLGNEQCDSSDLILPHPRLHERRFVLQPLADIRPELVLAGQAKCIAQILKELKSNEAPLVALS